MHIRFGNGKTEYGRGVIIELSGDEVALAIDTYLAAHDVHTAGPRTTKVNGELIDSGFIYVDPSGFVISGGEKFSGRGS